MPSKPIQTLPVGLLGLLSVKNLGQNPETLLDTVQPTIDLFDMWSNWNIEQGIQASTRTLATGAGSVSSYSTDPLTVPDGEWWWVKHYTVIAVLPAAAGELVDNFAPVIIYNTVPSISFQQLTEGTRSVAGLAARSVQAAIACRDFWAPAGSQLGFFTGQVVSGTVISFSALARFVRVPI